MEIAIEAKAATKISGKHLKGLRSLKEDHPKVKRRIVVCCDDKGRKTEDGIEILPASRFAEMLWQGKIAEAMRRAGFTSITSRTVDTPMMPMDLDIARKAMP